MKVITRYWILWSLFFAACKAETLSEKMDELNLSNLKDLMESTGLLEEIESSSGRFCPDFMLPVADGTLTRKASR